ncbi:hypothetical protein CYMTET_34247 [Cymbomonas tetramitiformis]|uniref:Uncharacterized protein n=1 Tax=Cymbomonas tetramitiformis TaxID=36881 RepID=A0AAE0FBL3_9CHLO|nr:hypothetical protein CYMTET_34247 [Cymbomonas tetramitiformis]
MREAAEEYDRRTQETLRDLLPGGGLAMHSCEFATLPHGMALTKAARVSNAAWLGGFAQLRGEHAGARFGGDGGTEDLRAESDLPDVHSLQAAMQKVSEAVEVIEEARGANEHLPPQVPKADDVKKLSDYSRSQKRAQRVYVVVLHSADWLWLAGHVGAPRLPWFFSVTFNSIVPTFLRGILLCPASELSLAEYQVALQHILHAEQPLLGQVGECPDCGGELDPTGTHLLACRKERRAVEETEGPGQHVLIDVATTQPLSDPHLGAAMMGPGAAARKAGVEQGGNARGERRYMQENAGEEEQVDDDGCEDEDEDEDEEAALGSFMGWKRLAMMGRAREDAVEETDNAMQAGQDGHGGGTQGSGGTQHGQSGQASGGAGEAGRMASRLLESMEEVRQEAETVLAAEGQGLGPERGWTAGYVDEGDTMLRDLERGELGESQYTKLAVACTRVACWLPASKETGRLHAVACWLPASKETGRLPRVACWLPASKETGRLHAGCLLAAGFQGDRSPARGLPAGCRLPRRQVACTRVACWLPASKETGRLHAGCLLAAGFQGDRASGVQAVVEQEAGEAKMKRTWLLARHRENLRMDDMELMVVLSREKGENQQAGYHVEEGTWVFAALRCVRQPLEAVAGEAEIVGN